MIINSLFINHLSLSFLFLIKPTVKMSVEISVEKMWKKG
jgi:hypothetical protein